MSDKLVVNIIGKEYIVSGGNSRDRVIAAAGEVDNMIREVEASVSRSMSSADIAVLAALNIANDMAELRNTNDQLKKTNEKLEGDTQHYMKVWDDAKKTFTEYSDQNVMLMQQRDDLVKQLAEKEVELKNMKEGRGSFESEIKEDVNQQLKEAEAKYKDLENNFFELQMENIKLKSQVEDLQNENERLSQKEDPFV